MKTKKQLVLYLGILAINAVLIVAGIGLLIEGVFNGLEYSLYLGAIMIVFGIWQGWKTWKEYQTNQRVEISSRVE